MGIAKLGAGALGGYLQRQDDLASNPGAASELTPAQKIGSFLMSMGNQPDPAPAASAPETSVPDTAMVGPTDLHPPGFGADDYLRNQFEWDG